MPLPWQQPNITEACAAQRLEGVSGYMSFPWATWIDRAKRGCPPELPPLNNPSAHGPRATVCQHIWALEHLDLFHRAGITDLFWSHALNGGTQISGIRIHPFPLYPVRDWLLNLPPRPDTQLERRQEWHYEQAVYREQVEGQEADPVRHAQLNAEANAYATTLQHSCFALCPSGSGPNSIRLWEALGYGAIPVILSDQLQLPGTAPLWEAAALFVPETQAAVKALPSQLEALVSDHQRLETMQQAGQQLWRRYGLNGFVGDVRDFLRDPLAMLRARALLSLPGDAVNITARSPAELPLEVRRCLRTVPPDRPLLILITDQDDSELLRIRWRLALKICCDLIGVRPWSVASVSLTLEAISSSPVTPLSLKH